MGFRERLHPQVSNAEITIFEGLSRRQLTSGLRTQQDIILKKTKPDFSWFEKRKAVYIDGEQVHQQKQEYDEEIQTLLERHGWDVLRISYHAPLSEKRLEEILDEIAEFLGPLEVDA